MMQTMTMEQIKLTERNTLGVRLFETLVETIPLRTLTTIVSDPDISECDIDALLAKYGIDMDGVEVPHRRGELYSSMD